MMSISATLQRLGSTGGLAASRCNHTHSSWPHLTALSKNRTTLHQCVADCVAEVHKQFKLEAFDLSKNSQQTLQACVTDFNGFVDDEQCLSLEEATSLKELYKNSLLQSAEETWHQIMAEAFHAVAALSDPGEQAQKAKEWTHHYFLGLDYLCTEFSLPMAGSFVATFGGKTAAALTNYSCRVHEKRFDEMQMLWNRNPFSFEEKAHVELRVLAACAHIEENREFLKHCIWTGYVVHRSKRSILDKNSSLFEPSRKE